MAYLEYKGFQGVTRAIVGQTFGEALVSVTGTHFMTDRELYFKCLDCIIVSITLRCVLQVCSKADLSDIPD